MNKAVSGGLRCDCDGKLWGINAMNGDNYVRDFSAVDFGSMNRKLL